jgi:hypothetical protein
MWLRNLGAAGPSGRASPARRLYCQVIERAVGSISMPGTYRSTIASASGKPSARTSPGRETFQS